jgi:hypothetical protein
MIDDGVFIVNEGTETIELLIHALSWQHFACYMFDRGASASANDEDGYDPLMMACIWGCVGPVRALLAQGVDPTVSVKRKSVVER